MAQSAEVFLSYSREDKARVLELAGRLRAAGVNLWIDHINNDAPSAIPLFDAKDELPPGSLMLVSKVK